MEKVFVGYSFDSADHATRLVLDLVGNVLRAHGIALETGEVLEGQDLTPAIQERILAADALIAILSPRGAPDDDGLKETSRWVSDELGYARAREKPAVPVVLPGIRRTSGMYGDRERIELDPGNPLPGVSKLVATVGAWKQRAGRTLKVRVEPLEVARLLVSSPGATCEARITTDNGEESDWQRLRVSRQEGGVFVTVKGVKDGAMIQLRAIVKGEIWQSVESQQWVYIPLEKQP